MLILLGPIAAAIVAGFGVLYRDGLRSRDSQIAYLSEQLTAAHERLNRGIPVLDEAETIARERAAGKRRS